MIIRKPKKEDAPSYLELINVIVDEGEYTAIDRKLSLKEEVEWLENALANDAKNNLKILCAEIDGVVVGNCMVTKGAGANSHLGTLGVVVHCNHRRSRVGSKLIEEASKVSKNDLKIDKIILQVRSGNTGAEAFYRKKGFKKYGSLNKGLRIGDKYHDTIFMYKEL